MAQMISESTARQITTSTYSMSEEIESELLPAKEESPSRAMWYLGGFFAGVLSVGVSQLISWDMSAGGHVLVGIIGIVGVASYMVIS